MEKNVQNCRHDHHNNDFTDSVVSDGDGANNNQVDLSESEENKVDLDYDGELACKESGTVELNGAMNNKTIDTEDKVKGPNPCEICEMEPSRYACPRCSLRTCSVSCVNEHKKRLDCDGQRDKTAFVGMSDYSDMHLLNDYRFLEDAERSLYSNKMVQKNNRHVFGGPYHLNKRCKLLLSAAQKRGVKLRLLPMAMSKNKTNTSFYVVKSDNLQWHIDWLFTLTNTLVKDPKVPETTTLVEAAGKFTNFVQYPHLRKALEGYKKEKLTGCTFLLKLEGLPANRQRYFHLNPEASIADSLRGHCVTEYPTVCVVPESTGEDYQLLSQDDIPHMQTDHARHMMQHHKWLDPRPKLEDQLLNPTSEIYTNSKSS